MECPEQSGSGPLEDARVGSHSIPVQPPACPQEGDTPRARDGPSAVPGLTSSLCLFLQTSMSAPLTGPATTSASTPPAASSASATRATRSTGSPTAEVGPAGCWQLVTAPGSGHTVPLPLRTLPTPRAQGERPVPRIPRAEARQGRGSQPDSLVSATSNRATGTICDLSAAGEREKSPAFLAGSCDGVGRGTSKGFDLNFTKQIAPKGGGVLRPGSGEADETRFAGAAGACRGSGAGGPG